MFYLWHHSFWQHVVYLGSLLIIIPGPELLFSDLYIRISLMVKKINKLVCVAYSIFIAGSKMSSVPATFKVCRARHHDKLVLSTFGRNIYSFHSLSTWFYLWFSHLGVYDTCFIPFVFSPWYSRGKLDSPTRWPPGPPWMTKSLWVSPQMHANTHMHAHMHIHTARNANICINYKMENWKWLLPKGVKVYCCGFLIIILTCCHKIKTWY